MSLYTLPPTQYALDYSPGALDLSRSRRVGSVEPRKTPSPSMASPNGYISPSYPTSPRFTQYLTYQEVARPLRKTPSPYDEPRQSKVDDDMGAYLLQAAAFQQQLIQSRIAQSCHSSDDASETGDAFQGYPIVRDAKVTRPFKAYPKDPLALAAGFTAADALLDTHSAEKYSAFRKRMLDQIHAANGGQATVSNPKMRRNIPPANTILEEGNLEGHVKDVAYFERRKKNNAAAKKSRDRRRVKEDEIAIRAAFLERENIELKIELASARKQLSMYSLPTLPV